jgi:hypothetical protein
LRPLSMLPPGPSYACEQSVLFHPGVQWQLPFSLQTCWKWTWESNNLCPQSAR